MDNNEKLEFIKEKLEANAEKMPLTLNKENIVSALDNIEQKKTVKLFTMKRVVPVAASIAIVILSAVAMKMFYSSSLESEPDISQTVPTTSASMNAVDENASERVSEYKEDDYSDIIEYFKSLREKYSDRYSGFVDEGDVYYKGESTDVTMAAPEGSAPAYDGNSSNFGINNAVASSKPSSFGQTNTQVDGVDEADIIKNDGTYLYIAKSNSRVLIYRAADLALMSDIKIEPQEKESVNIENMYLSSGRLVIIARLYEKTQSGDFYVKPTFGYFRYSLNGYRTEAYVYDVENVASPKLVFTNTQDGYCKTSRLIGSTLYTVTEYGANAYYDKDADDKEIADTCIPKINGKKIPRNNIDFSEKTESSYYVVVSACDIENGKPTDSGYAYFGNVNDSYCTTDTLYLSSCKYLEKKEAKKLGLKEGEHTYVYAVSLSESGMKFKNSAYVPGTFINQFSMDEYNGYFRCAVTYYDDNYDDVSSVIIYDSDFKEVSRLEDLADDEQIKAVRFMGDTAYVVTFRNTDPLFVLDLSDPTDPKKDGEVKLPGFSAYLHPISEKYIVGVGYGGNFEGTDDSIQITLFDVSDKKHPVVVSKYKIRNVSTEVNYNFKAFLYYPEESTFGIPVEKWTAYSRVEEFVFFKVEDGKLGLLNQYKHDVIKNDGVDIVIEYDESDDEFDNSFLRGTYIGETLYTMSERKICAFDIASAEKTGEVNLGK